MKPRSFALSILFALRYACAGCPDFSLVEHREVRGPGQPAPPFYVGDINNDMQDDIFIPYSTSQDWMTGYYLTAKDGTQGGLVKSNLNKMLDLFWYSPKGNVLERSGNEVGLVGLEIVGSQSYVRLRINLHSAATFNVIPLTTNQKKQSRPALADFDGDGWLDAAVLANRNLYITLGSKSGNFSEPRLIAMEMVPENSPRVSTGVIIGGTITPEIWLVTEDTSPPYPLRFQSFVMENPSRFPKWLDVSIPASNGVDMNRMFLREFPQGTGIIIGNSVTLVKPKQSEFVEEKLTIFEKVKDPWAENIDYGDIDGDNVPDRIWTARDGLIHVALGDKVHNPALWPETFSVGLSEIPHSLALADLDHDGKKEIVAMTGFNPWKIKILKGECKGKH
jgi:hypothetical protein